MQFVYLYGENKGYMEQIWLYRYHSGPLRVTLCVQVFPVSLQSETSFDLNQGSICISAP